METGLTGLQRTSDTKSMKTKKKAWKIRFSFNSILNISIVRGTEPWIRNFAKTGSSSLINFSQMNKMVMFPLPKWGFCPAEASPATAWSCSYLGQTMALNCMVHTKKVTQLLWVDCIHNFFFTLDFWKWKNDLRLVFSATQSNCISVLGDCYICYYRASLFCEVEFIAIPMFAFHLFWSYHSD